MRPQERIEEFHAGAMVPDFASLDTIGQLNRLDLREALITEEYNEVLEELDFFPVGGTPDPEALRPLAKELADLLVVVYGTAAELGIPLDDIYDEVMDSNMTKLIDPQFREDGKLLKGDHYRPPDMTKFF